MKTKLLTLFVALIVATTLSASNTQVDGIWYVFDDTNLTAYVTYRGSSSSSYNNEYTDSIVIPASVSYDSKIYSVTKIGAAAFSSCKGLTSVTIPNSVTTIGISAFEYCSDLTSITIPSSVTTIGDDAFSSCSGLTSITIPNSVTTIGEYAFSGCTGLTSVIIGNSVTTIGKYAFNYCISLTSITIGDSVTTIGGYAFSGCSSLTSVTIPNSVTTIGYTPFYDCSSLTSVTINSNAICSKNDPQKSYVETIFGSQVKEYIIGDSVTTIGENAFSGCSSLTSVIIGNSVTTIGDFAFEYCRGLTSVTIPSSVTTIGNCVFRGCTGLTSVTIPNSVTTIGKTAFSGCSGLTSITIPSSVTTIESYTFSGCSGLTSVTIPNSVTTIGYSAFYGCKSLTSVTIPNSVTTIGSSAFEYCSSLTSITIPSSVTTLGEKAFSSCSSLTSVTINSNAICSKNYTSSIVNIGTIFGPQVMEYIIPNSVTTIGVSTFYNVLNVVYHGPATGSPWGAKNVNKYVEGYLVYDDDTKKVLCACSTAAKGKIVIPSSVTTIKDKAFSGCTDLNSVTIPSSVTTIGNSVFSGCTGLISVTIPNSVTTIGNSAFNNCYGLTSVTIPNSVTTIGEKAFYGCSGLTSVTIPNSVTTIGSSAFYYCSRLTSVTIPNSVTTIGEKAFYGCSGLTSVIIGNSVTTIGASAFYDCRNLTSITLLSECIPTIGAGAFYNVPSPVYNSHNFMYMPTSYTGSYSIPNGIQQIVSGAFSGCTMLTSVTIPSSVTTIGDNAFYNCSGLTSITIGDSVTTIGKYAFEKCSSLTSVTIPNSVTTIGDNAFEKCSSLTSLELDGIVALTDKTLPKQLDTLVCGLHCDSINIQYVTAKNIIWRNPMTVVYGIKSATPTTSLYDFEGTGTLYSATKISNSKNIIVNTLYGKTTDTLYTNYIHNKEFYNSDVIICNTNNDSIADFCLEDIVYQSDKDGTYTTIDFNVDYAKYNDGKKNNHIFQLDADLDGLQDFYLYKEGKHYIQLRQRDGSYLQTELNILTDTAAVDSAIYQLWEKATDYNSYVCLVTSFPSLKDNMYIKAPARKGAGNNQQPMLRMMANASPAAFNQIDMAIDLDRNGLVDLVESSTGSVLYNLGDNRFVMSKFPGSVIAKDINGDGILDYVIYNEISKTVSLQIYEGDGNVINKTLMSNLNISAIWCYDFDNDGDIDILLPFDWTSASGYAYLVFWRNDGNNTFKKIENAFDDPIKHFQFLDCRDVDNDGKYEIIACDSVVSAFEIKNGNYYLIRYNNRFKTTVDAVPFAAKTISNALTPNQQLFVYGDFNNDGINDCYYVNRPDAAYTLSHFTYTTLNTPPAKMGTPRFVCDAENARLNISWDRGSDAQCSALDLTYSIRIGSKPGAGDMWFAAANSDGTQRSLYGANVGAYLSQMVNVEGWKEGDYYIAVQAIDPNGLGGEWSDEVVYTHTLLSANFNVSNHEISTADTLTVKYSGCVDNQHTYTWNFGDSAVVLSQEEQTYNIVYHTPGTKTISLQVTAADGRKSPLSSQNVRVNAIRIDTIKSAPTMAYFDMDMDGVVDGIGYYKEGYTILSQGFFKGRNDGSFIKLAKTYNSDLTLSEVANSCIFADANMDGLPDVVLRTSKGSLMYNMEDFDVDFTNDIYTLPFAPDETYDFNNDGIPDTYAIKNTHTILLLLTTEGGTKDTVELYLPSEFPLNSVDMSGLRVDQDFDNNGHPDFIVSGTNFGALSFIVYLYDNDSVSCQLVTERNFDSYPFIDINNDGVPDMDDCLIRSNIANTRPEIPQNLRAVQVQGGIKLYWDAAKDKETPSAQMRYNISLKKQGMSVGEDNAFVISPMNGLYDEATIVPGYTYFKGTETFVPVSKLETGKKYEFQIQSIDLWNAHSDMSPVYTFEVAPQIMIDASTEACLDADVTITYVGPGTNGFVWDFAGGIITNGTGAGPYQVHWTTPGLKTITLTVNGIKATHPIYVKENQDLSFSMPSACFANSWMEFDLPEIFRDPAANIQMRTSSNLKKSNILIDRNSLKARVKFDASGTTTKDGWIELYQVDSICGERGNHTTHTQVIGYAPTPVISIVTVDSATGKNCVIWDAPDAIPNYVDKIYVYKEDGSVNNWVKQTEMSVSAGQWIDAASDPTVRRNRYCISYGTDFGAESAKSVPHASPHLQINKGLSGTINLNWTKYEGGIVSQYSILRGTSTESLQVIATIPGTETTYSDINAPENVYYALEYDNSSFETWEWNEAKVQNRKAANSPSATRSGHSNVMASALANEVTFAERISICAMESTIALSAEQPTLHLYTEILPMQTTYKRTIWSVVSGANLATLTDNGVLINNTQGLNGTIRIRATAIDGSGIYTEKDIPVQGIVSDILINSINLSTEDGNTTLSNQISSIMVSAVILPTNATNVSVEWNLLQGEDKVIIIPNDNECMVNLQTGASNGIVLLSATATDGSEVVATIELNVINGTPTDLRNQTISLDCPTKIIRENKLFIIMPNGAHYNATGLLLK